MSKSIYSQLFAYRERPNKAPLEDFLTEILRHFLSELNHTEITRFCKDCFIPAILHSNFDKVTNGKDLRCITQKIISNNKRLDLVIEIEGHPIVIIESKLWSGIGVHTIISGSEEPITQSQLHTYGTWQSNELRRSLIDWPGVLVFLTHNTLAPIDFDNYTDKPYNVATKKINWSYIYRYIQKYKSNYSLDPSQSHISYIAKSLSDFLQEKGMGEFSMKPTDLAAIQLYMHSGPAVEGTISDISKAVVERFGNNLNSRGGYDAITVATNKVVSGWRFFKHNGVNTQTCIWWGIRFSYESDLWNDLTPSLPESTCVFVAVVAEGAPIDMGALLGSLPNGQWSHNDSSAVRAIDIANFNRDPENMSANIKSWIMQELEIAVPCVLPLL